MDEQIQDEPFLTYTGNPVWSRIALIVGPTLLVLEVLGYLGAFTNTIDAGNTIILLAFAVPTIGFSWYGYRFIKTYRILLSRTSITVKSLSGQKSLPLDHIGLLVLRTTHNGYGSGIAPAYLIYDRQGKLFEQMNVTQVRDFRNFMLHLKLYSASSRVYLVKDNDNSAATTTWRVNLPGTAWQNGEPPQRYHATVKTQIIQSVVIVIVTAVVLYAFIHWANGLNSKYGF